MENTSVTASGPNLQALWESVKCLVKPLSRNESDGIKDLPEALQLNLRKAASALGCEDIQKIPHQGDISKCGSDSLWDFVEVSLFVMLQLKEKLQNDDLGVSHQKDVRSCLQFIVSLGIRPNILPNVLQNVSDNTAALTFSQGEVTTVMQKYERLCVVVKALLKCCDSTNFRSLIIVNIIHPLLGALFQLSFAPLKKPTPDSCSNTAVDNTFIMTDEIWNKLQKDKLCFRIMLQQLVKETYQPKIIFELMLLQSNQKDYVPALWLKKASSSILTACIVQEGGVAALFRATFDSVPDTGNDWKKIETVARVVTSPVNHYVSIASQLSKLIIETPIDGSPDMHHVILTCIRQLLEKDPVICHSLIIKPLMQPLELVYSNVTVTHEEGYVLLSEDEINSLVKRVHLCFTASGSKVSSANLPGKILTPYVSFFFSLFCKVHGSASYAYKFSEDILYHILCDNDQLGLIKILRCLLLKEDTEEVHILPKHFRFQFGAAGGVSLEICSEFSVDLLSSDAEEYGDMLMNFLEKRSHDELQMLIFEALLKMLIEIGMKPKPVASKSTSIETFEDALASLMLSSEKHLGIVRLLAALVENSNVKQKLSKTPGPILNFIVNFLETLASRESHPEIDEDELECVFVAFMVLNVMLDNCDEGSDWSLFRKLLNPVGIIRDKFMNDELKRLASRVHNIVSTSGSESNCTKTNQEKCEKTRCEQALHDACDPLLPVRGHALVQLTKLLQQRDVETLAKKEAVFCLFKENLNNSDSYIYLAAINGMVAYAAVQPDVVVNSLTQEYITIITAGESSSRNPELRMKMGEILVKLVRELGGLAPKYKNDLINAFLIGTKDEDHLMRASSLSNLGEVCQILGFRIGPVLRELLICIQSILRYDKAVEPRRASVMVITHLLKGLEADTLTVLQDAALELYRHLKSVYSEDKDEVVRLHAQLALEELGRLAQNLLFPKVPLEKKIQILP